MPVAAWAALIVAAPAGKAENAFGSGVVRVISTFPAGGPVDIIARIVANGFAKRLGGAFIVENRPGAGGTLGARYVANASADGRTLLFASQANLIGAAMYKDIGYDPVKSFTAIGSVSSSPWILVVGNQLPVGNLAEFVKYAKSNPGKLNFGFGLGSAPQLIGELFKAKAGIDLISVPYKGGVNATSDLLSGQIHMAFGTAATLLPLIQSGQVRPLAVTASERIPELPDVPTMAEAGIAGLPERSWTGLMGPAGLPRDSVELLNSTISDIVNEETARASMVSVGDRPEVTTPASFSSFLAADMEQWQAAVKTANVTPF